MKNILYLDNAATTLLDAQVREAMLPWLGELYGNPSSIHALGQKANLAINEARLSVANTLGCESEEIFFTGSATEANNMILRGIAHAAGKGHIITSAVEHSCVLNTCRALAEEGFDLTVLPVDQEGRYRAEDLVAALRPDTFLVSLQLVNNEIGTIQPLQECLQVIQDRAIFVHTDAVAAFPTLFTGLRKFPVHAMTLSPHKYHGPQGVGIAYVRAGVPCTPLITGGGQEFGKRAGTQNVPAIVGAGIATTLVEQRKFEEACTMYGLREYALSQLQSLIPGLHLFGPQGEDRIATNIGIGIPGVSGERVVIDLDIAGVCVSKGSACTNNSRDLSHVVQALGLPEEVAETFVRITLSRHTTTEDIDRLCSLLARYVS